MSLDKEDRKTIGEDIKSLQFGWPLGMPLVRKMGTDLWQIRSQLPNRIARVIFTVQDDNMVLLYEFIKKSRKTPKAELNLAKRRLTHFKEHEQ
ncbi:MAG: type II toxin-antitoxin system RelE/ParE family toxin [Planctomycetota bacterium]